MARLRLAICQIDTVVGDLWGNVARVLDALSSAETAGAVVAVFPELAVTGYPPEDLLERPAFVADNLAALEHVAARTGSCAAVVGHVARRPDGRLVNAATLCRDGSVVATYAKRLLPNYGVFDEQRWFVPGEGPPELVEVAGVPTALSVCEDIWLDGGPVHTQAEAGARLVLSLNASPYSIGRQGERLEVVRRRAVATGCVVAYANQVGGQDELVFDGGSLVVDPTGSLVASAPLFEEAVLVADVELPDVELPEWPPRPPVRSGPRPPAPGPVRSEHSRVVAAVGDGLARALPPSLPPVVTGVAASLDADAEVYRALVVGTADYLGKNGFRDAVVGLSGGIDSSLVATVAVDALGADHVHGVTMPSRYSSAGSVADARALAENLGIACATVPIEAVHVALADTLAPVLDGAPTGLTDENLQSRIRGVLLMAMSNANGWIVLTTGNKSEMATGYSTLYGDSAGGFAVIKDVPKTLVYRLCRYRNRVAGRSLVPETVLDKAPSAELRPDQRDADSLPPYDVLDPVLAGYVERDRSAEELVAAGFDRDVVEQVVRLVDRAEYKRRQTPPGVRITTKAFGKDRRMPITNRYGAASRGQTGGGADVGARSNEPEAGAPGA
ncbi:MAG: NAD+ synthase [Acidimicrobiales bacterium]